MRVAGGQRGRFGHVFTLAGRQSCLLFHTHCLNAEDGPLSLARAPTARRAFLPVSDPPPNTNGGYRRQNSLKVNGLPVIKNNNNYCSENVGQR